MTGSWVAATILAYMFALFVVAWRADRRGASALRPRARAIYYALSLGALCSSWTYFAAAGLAMGGSWLYLGNFLGPVLAITVFYPIWRRIALLSKQENVGSIADFVSARYGKSRALGSLVAGVAIVAALPYIALQLVSLTKAWAFVANRAEAPALATPILVASLAGFAILFGARRPSLTQHGRGLTKMIAVESTVKIVALLSVAGLCVVLILGHGVAPGAHPIAAPLQPPFSMSLVTATIICMASALTLPRQFHLSFVALQDPDDIATARWLVPAYMGLWALAIVPIALAANAGFSLPGIDRDMIVLGTPMLHGGPVLLAIAFIGGFSAGAAMVVVETIALSAMISNDLILPLLARTRWYARQAFDAGRVIVLVRRATIVVIHLLAWAYFVGLRTDSGLTKLGFTSLTASAQLLPALVGGVLWRRGHERGALAGIVAGMAVWLAMIAGPELFGHAGWPLLEAHGIDAADGFEGSIVLSLVLNVFCYVVVSSRTSPKLIDSIQAATFVASRQPIPLPSKQPFATTVGDLRKLVAGFIGPEEAERAFEEAARGYPRAAGDGDVVTPVMARAAERMLSGAIGASSARNVVAIYLAADTRDAAEISQLLDEAGHAVQFSRELLQMTLDSLDDGVSVVDGEQRLIAWNKRYVELMGPDPKIMHVGTPLVDVLEASASLADARSPRPIERLAIIRNRERFVAERTSPHGMVLRIVGTPLVSGDYLTSVSDITEVHHANRTLAEMNEALERRVDLRTSELTAANAIAERATRAQRRFVAAASHDLVQPLHAARLFIASAAEDLRAQPAMEALLEKADLSLESADRLLRALLNLSRIEVGGLKPNVGAVDAGALLSGLFLEFEPLARSRGLELVMIPTQRWVFSDGDLLHSVLQNLLTNAVRYTPAGRVVLGCRPHGDAVRFEVRDSGIGIDDAMLPLIFQEFSRLPGSEATPGAGLGLSIAERICHALGHRIDVRSRPGRGSVFSIVVPAARSGATAGAAPASPEPTSLGGMRILFVEDDPDVAGATGGVLSRWGADVETARSVDEALSLSGEWDVVIADYHLGTGPTGLDYLETMRERVRTRLLITANHDDELARASAAAGVVILRKPVATAVLRAFLMHLRKDA